MNKLTAKEVPSEKQRDLLIELNALKLPLLYQSLVETYGEEKGRKTYEELFETNFKKRSKQFEGKDGGGEGIKPEHLGRDLQYVLPPSERERVNSAADLVHALEVLLQEIDACPKEDLRCASCRDSVRNVLKELRQ